MDGSPPVPRPGTSLTASWIAQACAVTLSIGTAVVLLLMGVLNTSSAPMMTVAWLLAPAVILAIALVPWRGRRIIGAVSAIAVAVFCVIASATVGWFFLPALACAVAGLLIPKRRR